MSSESTDLIHVPRQPEPVDPDADVHIDDSDRNITEFAVKLRLLPREQRIEEAYKLKMQGMSQATIAKTFGVTTQTISKWLREYVLSVHEHLTNQTRADLVCENLAWLSNLEEMFLYDARHAEVIANMVEGDDVVFGNFDPNAARNRLPNLKAALETRQVKIKLLQDTGILQKAPEKLYHYVHEEKMQEAIPTGEERSPEEIKKSIAEIAARGLTID